MKCWILKPIIALFRALFLFLDVLVDVVKSCGLLTKMAFLFIFMSLQKVPAKRRSQETKGVSTAKQAPSWHEVSQTPLGPDAHKRLHYVWFLSSLFKYLKSCQWRQVNAAWSFNDYEVGCCFFCLLGPTSVSCCSKFMENSLWLIRSCWYDTGELAPQYVIEWVNLCVCRHLM